MSVGHKTCKACGQECGPRQKICAKCNTPFTFKGQPNTTQTPTVRKPRQRREITIPLTYKPVLSHETDKFKVGHTVRIMNCWADSVVKGKRARVTGFQRNGFVIFAKVRWLGYTVGNFNEKYGVLFPIDELRMVD